MRLKVFISYSTDNIGVVDWLQYLLEANGIETHVAVLAPVPGSELSDKVKGFIKECDFFLTFLTAGGSRSQWVNREIELASQTQPPKIILPIVEIGVSLPSYLENSEFIWFDPTNPLESANLAAKYLHKLNIDKDSQAKATAVVLLTLGLLALYSATLILSPAEL